VCRAKLDAATPKEHIPRSLMFRTSLLFFCFVAVSVMVGDELRVVIVKCGVVGGE
jgi:hypothetical protein